MCFEMVDCSQSVLLEVFLALHVSCRFSCRLNGWQQHRDKNSNDRHDDQLLDQRKTMSETGRVVSVRSTCGQRHSSSL